MYSLKLENSQIYQYLPLAKSLASKFNFLPYEDRFQEACLGLVKAYKTYKTAKSTPFGVYAKKVILNQLRNYYNKERDLAFFFVNDSNNEEHEQFVERVGNVSQNYSYVEIVESLKSSLGEFKTKVVLEICNGRSQMECAKLFKISQPSISRILKEAKNFIGGLNG
jgi:RNA polymerase sigma factor (sigma-70 family)